MAGHRRTARGKGVTNGRRNRVAKPADQITPTARARRIRNSRQLVHTRLAAEPDPLRRLDIALGYVRAAAQHATPNPRDIDIAVAALVQRGHNLLERS